MERHYFGLYDMSGNVYEWVWDWKDSYSGNDGTDLVGPDSGPVRVYRGGSWFDGAGGTRVSYRYSFVPTLRNDDLGFRLSRISP